MTVLARGADRRSSGRRSAVLQALRDAPEPLSIGTIADALGVHQNTVRFHLDALERDRQVERVEVKRGATGRPPLMYRPVRGMDQAGPRRYEVLAELLVQSLANDPDGTARAVEAGRAWGRRRGSPDRRDGDGSGDSMTGLVDLLDELGFAPERRGSAGVGQIGLRHCPFLELAQGGSQIACSVHLGLMQGAMQAWQSPITVDRLDPFVEPDLCLAHLGATGGH